MKPRHASAAIFSSSRKLRLAYFVSHPIQYQAPLLKRIAEEADIDLKVFFASDFSVRGHMDEGFGIDVTWDTALLDGYSYEFLPTLCGLRDGETPSFLSPINIGIRKKLDDGQFDAVWVHGYHYLTTLSAIHSASVLGIPVLLRAESTALAGRSRSQVKLVLKRVFFNYLRSRLAAALAIGKENASFWKRYLGEEFVVFPCPYTVDNEFFQSACETASSTREDFRASLGLHPDRPLILFAAKLIRRKECHDLLEAYLRLTTTISGALVPYLLIVGDGEQRNELETRAKQIAQDGIRFLGFRNQSELPRFYDLCDVFVLPSTDEPWGLTVNEVMNAGRPVIVSDQVGCRADLVRDGVNGWSFKAGDVTDLALRLRNVLEDKQRASSMGLESLKIVRDYSFDQNVSGLRDALHALYPGFAEA